MTLMKRYGGGAMYNAYAFVFLTSEYIVAGNRNELYRRRSLPCTVNEDDLSGRAFLYSTIFIYYTKEVNIHPSLIKNNTYLVSSQLAPYIPGLRAEVLWRG
jgi:hypothetical protein